MEKHMKAAVVREFGRPISIEDVPVPVPGPGEVLVKIMASGVCHTDLHAAEGDWPVKPTLPFIPGHEGAGIVASVGPGVTTVKEGAERILPECQRLQVGDVIPIGRGAGFPVKALEPRRSLVLGGESGGFQWVWEFGLYPVDDGHARLISRNRARVPKTVGAALFMSALEPAAFIRTRKMLLGLKRRAETTASQRPDRHASAA